MTRKQQREKVLALMKKSKRRKYGNRVSVVDGIRFDSAKEARRWSELRMLEKAGKIVGLCRQHKFALDVWCPTHPGTMRTIGAYVADFVYWDVKRSQQVVEDVKGGRATQTPLYRWKKKHMEIQWGYKILET